MKKRPLEYKSYSLFGYRQVDGRTSFSLTPWPKLDCLLVNIKQLDIYFTPKADSNLVLLSWEEGFRLGFDARYHVCGELGSGAPQVIMIRGSEVIIEPLDYDYFMNV